MVWVSDDYSYGNSGHFCDSRPLDPSRLVNPVRKMLKALLLFGGVFIFAIVVTVAMFTLAPILGVAAIIYFGLQFLASIIYLKGR